MYQIDQDKLQVLRDYTPRTRTDESLMKAAVAIILRDTDNGAEMLLMQRAFHPKDPWSGQMAFPGGKIDPTDASPKAAAIREAYEEVGVELKAEDFVCRLDDLYGLKANQTFSVHISCYVFKPQRELVLQANEEVADMLWLPISHLNDQSNAHDYFHPKDSSLSMPAVMINEAKSQILWGLSLRMLITLYRILGVPMSALSEEQKAQLDQMEQRELSKETLEMVKQAVNRR